jgi:hypothetical protein
MVFIIIMEEEVPISRRRQGEYFLTNYLLYFRIGYSYGGLREAQMKFITQELPMIIIKNK